MVWKDYSLNILRGKNFCSKIALFIKTKTKKPIETCGAQGHIFIFSKCVARGLNYSLDIPWGKNFSSKSLYSLKQKTIETGGAQGHIVLFSKCVARGLN